MPALKGYYEMLRDMEVGEPLPVPVAKGAQARLSQEARVEITKLIGRKPGPFLFQLFLAWATILGAIGIAVLAKNIWISLLAIGIVATRQNLLGLLIHEQAHCLGFKAGKGDILVNLTAGFPLLFLTVEGYATIHLSHHAYYFSGRDPDYIRKQGKEWTFPMKAARFARLFLADVTGSSTVKTIRGKKPTGIEIFKRKAPTPKWIRVGMNLALAVVFTLTGSWDIFFWYWAVPLATVFQMIIRWGAICEHKYNLLNPMVEESTPIILPCWWERLLLPNLNFTLHIYHHYFPGIAFSNLPKVHRIFQREGLVNESNVFHGFLPFLKFLLTFPGVEIKSLRLSDDAFFQSSL